MKFLMRHGGGCQNPTSSTKSRKGHLGGQREGVRAIKLAD